jgi:hypothetical protein
MQIEGSTHEFVEFSAKQRKEEQVNPPSSFVVTKRLWNWKANSCEGDKIGLANSRILLLERIMSICQGGGEGTKIARITWRDELERIQNEQKGIRHGYSRRTDSVTVERVAVRIWCAHTNQHWDEMKPTREGEGGRRRDGTHRRRKPCCPLTRLAPLLLCSLGAAEFRRQAPGRGPRGRDWLLLTPLGREASSRRRAARYLCAPSVRVVQCVTEFI